VAFETDAALVGGVTAVSIDGDGITDRLYLADAAWRVWRLQRVSPPGTSPPRFSATRLAELGAMAQAGAALQFAPDVALMAGSPRALEIALGSSNTPGAIAARHWLFVLRDPLTATTFAPIRPADLQRVGATSATPLAPVVRGLAASLDGPLAAPVLTVAGHRLVVTRASGATAVCPLRVEEPETFQVALLTPELAWITRTVPAATGSRLWLTPARAGDASTLPRLECRLGDALLPHCPEIRAVRRDYWLREDAQ